MAEEASDLLALTDAQARRLAGVSMRRLRYWEQVGLVVPSIKKKLSPHNTVRLCADWDASTVLGAHLDAVVARLEARTHLTVRVSKDGVTGSSDWR